MNDVVDEEGAFLKKKRPRRASAPPTAAAGNVSKTPDADWGDWLSRDERPASGGLNAREAWMQEQRPPHWD